MGNCGNAQGPRPVFEPAKRRDTLRRLQQVGPFDLVVPCSRRPINRCPRCGCFLFTSWTSWRRTRKYIMDPSGCAVLCQPRVLASIVFETKRLLCEAIGRAGDSLWSVVRSSFASSSTPSLQNSPSASQSRKTLPTQTLSGDEGWQCTKTRCDALVSRSCSRPQCQTHAA